MRRLNGRGLSSGTSPERIAPESLTPVVSGFVHRNISRSRSIQGTRSSLSAIDKARFGSKILKRFGKPESNQNQQRVKLIPGFEPVSSLAVIARSIGDEAIHDPPEVWIASLTLAMTVGYP